MLKEGLTLYFVRHGETDWNAVRRYQGQTDIPLNDVGRGQAARNGRVLAETMRAREHPEFIASPLMRTSETMSIIRREMGLKADDFPTDDRLKEINFGHWEGRLWDELAEENSPEFNARLADPFRWRPQDGESYADLAQRVASWLLGLQTDTIAVSHGGVSRVVRGHVLGLAENDIPLLEVPQDKVLVLRRGHIEWI